MFWEDIVLVTRQVEKYGLQRPFVEVGIGPNPCIADYELTIQSGEQDARFVQLNQRPFAHLDGEYDSLPLASCGPCLENLVAIVERPPALLLCFDVLHQSPEPFRLLQNLYSSMKQGGMLLCGALFAYPYNASQSDFWRLSPDCLEMLGRKAGFVVLESGWYLEVPSDGKVLNMTTGGPQEVRAGYATFSKGELFGGKRKTYSLPHRFSSNPRAQQLLNDMTPRNSLIGPSSAALIKDLRISSIDQPTPSSVLPVLRDFQTFPGAKVKSSGIKSGNQRGPVVLVSKEICFTFPLSYGYLAGYLVQQGEDVKVLFKNDQNLKQLVREIMTLKPLVVGFGSLYPELKQVGEIIRLLDAAGRDFPVLIGGQMVSPTPEFAVEVTGADFGAVGEAEITLYRLAAALREGRDPCEVSGLVIRVGRELISTGPGEYFQDLALLPPIPYELFPTEQWLPIGRWYAQNSPCPHWRLEDRVINVHGGRGCPYNCNFCYHHSKPRYRPISVIMSEAAEALERFNGNMLYFSDDLVIMNPRRAQELVTNIRDLKRRIEFSVSTRFDLLSRIDDSLLSEMKACGCRIMGLGVESGSDRILKIIGKNCTADTVLAQVERLTRFGIMPALSIMVGQDSETLDDVEASVRLMRETVRMNTNTNYFFSATTPYPGSALYELAMKRGLIRDHQHFYDLYFESGEEFQQVVNLSAMTMLQVREQIDRLNAIYREEKSKAPARKVFALNGAGENLASVYNLPFKIDCIMLDWNESVLVRCCQKSIDWQVALAHLQGRLFEDLLKISLELFPQLRDRWSSESYFNLSPFFRADLPYLAEGNVLNSYWFVIHLGES